MWLKKATPWLFALLSLAACGDDDPTPPDNTPKLTAVSVNCSPASVTVGQASQCSASATDQNGAPFTVSSYTWTSSNEAVAKVDSTGKATTLTAGSATITASATAGESTQKGTATVTVKEAPVTVHTANITANETWRAADNPHVVRANIEVLGASAPILTLEAGVEIRFDAGYELRVTNGALKALGTQAAPIRMIASDSAATKGFWRGLVFAAAGSDSELAFVTVSHCGNSAGQGACLALKNQAAPVLRNVTVQNSGTSGVSVADDGSAFGPASTTLSVSGSSAYAVRIGANQAGTIPTGGAFSGNTPDAVELQGNVTRSQTWPKLGIPYVASTSIRVEDASKPTLTLAAGTTVRFAQDTGMTVGEDAEGELVLNGTATEPVILTADASPPQPGYWRGVHLSSLTSDASKLSHATIEYAGAGDTGNLLVSGNDAGGGARPVVDTLTVQKSSAYGVYLQNGGAFGAGSTSLTARENGKHAISIEPDNASTLPAGGTFTGTVQIRCCSVVTTQTWPNLGIPYVLTSSVSVGAASSPILTLAAGTEVRFSANTELQIGNTQPGALKAVGTAAAPIRLVADTTTTTPGFWRGLHFWQASGSQLTYVTISQAGATGSIGTGNVNVYREIGAFMTDSTLTDSSGCGMTVSNGSHAGSTPVTTDFLQASYNNTFTDNAGGRQCIN